jgi:hypothetical protein
VASTTASSPLLSSDPESFTSSSLDAMVRCYSDDGVVVRCWMFYFLNFEADVFCYARVLVVLIHPAGPEKTESRTGWMCNKITSTVSMTA